LPIIVHHTTHFQHSPRTLLQVCRCYKSQQARHTTHKNFLKNYRICISIGPQRLLPPICLYMTFEYNESKQTTRDQGLDQFVLSQCLHQHVQYEN
jgi:hypothetical protein